MTAPRKPPIQGPLPVSETESQIYGVPEGYVMYWQPSTVGGAPDYDVIEEGYIAFGPAPDGAS